MKFNLIDVSKKAKVYDPLIAVAVKPGPRFCVQRVGFDATGNPAILQLTAWVDLGRIIFYLLAVELYGKSCIPIPSSSFIFSDYKQ